MKIAVGSKNPAKIGAVKSVVSRIWPESQVIPLSVSSGVSSMPMSDSECLMGARNRARAALNTVDIEMAVGLEGGVELSPERMLLLGWVAAVDPMGREGIASTARLPLPEHIARRVLDGHELGDVIDDILGETGVKQRGGTVGALTNGLVLRQDAFEMAVVFALSPFLAADLHINPT